jgi:uncharacterized ubiquitin-like protein YukD
MKNILIIFSFLCVFTTTIFAQVEEDLYFSKNINQYFGVKKIIDIRGKYKTIYSFDKEGQLIKVTHKRGLKKRIEKFKYVENDTALTIFCNYYNDIIKSPSGIIIVCSYNKFGRCVKMEYYSNNDLTKQPFIVLDSFVYDNQNLLLSYCGKGRCYKFSYNDNGLKNKKFKFKNQNMKDTLSITTYVYDNKNNLIKEEWFSEVTGFVSCDVQSFNKNKIISLYEDFDQYGNWTKSYFLTEKGKILRSKRKIKYYAK